jgi:ABC-2 type transport system ATP-binding protein
VESADTADHAVHLVAEDGRWILPAILEAAKRAEVVLNSVDVVEPDLEAVFLHLTGTALRE